MVRQYLMGKDKNRVSRTGFGPTRIRSRQRIWICEYLARLYGNRCFYCTGQFGEAGKIRTLDHLVPLCRGGTHHVSNLVLACKNCNQKKGDMTWAEYRATEGYHRRLVSVLEYRPPRPPIEVLSDLALDRL